MEVTLPDVPVLSAPAVGSDIVSVTVTGSLLASATTMSVRFSGVSSV